MPPRGDDIGPDKGPESQDGRTRLIETALALFAERGFDSVTVRDIAKASNLSIGLINHHFGSKEGLRAAVDAHFMAQFEEVLEANLGSAAQAPGSFETWADDWIERHRSAWGVTVAYFRRALLEESEWGANLFARFYAVAQNSVTRMDAQGGLRPDVDRLWLPFLMIYLELGTTLLDPYIKRILGRSGFESDLWRRRHRAYTSLLTRGVSPKARDR
jgi:TetR/AcrR family transcriptional regulator, regulator of cefoperazone and chloramphenicol sensitivity